MQAAYTAPVLGARSFDAGDRALLFHAAAAARVLGSLDVEVPEPLYGGCAEAANEDGARQGADVYSRISSAMSAAGVYHGYYLPIPEGYVLPITLGSTRHTIEVNAPWNLLPVLPGARVPTRGARGMVRGTSGVSEWVCGGVHMLGVCVCVGGGGRPAMMPHAGTLARRRPRG